MLPQHLVKRAVLDARSSIGSKTASAFTRQSNAASGLLNGIKCLLAASNASLRPSDTRAYATAVAQTTKPAPKRPATKSTTATKRTATKTKTATRKTTTKKSAAKKKPVKKAVKKPKKKPKKKPVKKAVKKPVKTRRVKPLTETQKTTAQVSRLRKLALLDTVPKGAPHTAYTLLIYQQTKGTTGSSITKLADVSRSYAGLSPEARADLNAEAHKNAREYEAKLKEFVLSHTVDEIRIANNARRALNRVAEMPLPAGRTVAYVGKRLPLLKDDRHVPRRSPYAEYNKSRWASGDFAGMSVPEASKVVGRDWRALPEAEKAKYAA